MKEGNFEKFDAICLLVSNGKALRNAVKIHHISTTDFYKMVDSDIERKEQYTRACEDRATAIFEDIIDISDDSSLDTTVVEKNGQTIEVENKEWVNRSRLRVDARKWILSKMNPKKYGDKIDVTSKDEKIISPLIIDLSGNGNTGTDKETSGSKKDS
jgi:hypothetical protein